MGQFSYHLPVDPHLAQAPHTPPHLATAESAREVWRTWLGSIIPKLYQLLEKEYNLQTHVKERLRSFTQELEHAQATLRKVAQVPWDQLALQVQLWAREVRDASYDMEDVLDAFLVGVQGPSDSAEEEKSLLKPLKKMMTSLLKTGKARRKISGDVKDIMTHLQEVAKRCRRYKVDDIVARPATALTIDPRLHAMYNKVKNLVGIDKSSGELMSKLQLGDMSNESMKIVSIVGIGGLGKTTLAKVVYDNLEGKFDARAFVSVGRSPDLQKVLQMILIALDKKTYEKFNFSVLQDLTQFIDELQGFLHDNMRYFIVVDDLWEKQSWETIKLAIDDDKNCEGRIIITTRKWEVAQKADEVYELPPLPYDRSRKLFYSRIYGDERKYVVYQSDEVSDEIISKCDGYYDSTIYYSRVRIEHLGHLLHLRFLGLNGMGIEKISEEIGIPEEIGALKLVQTLDLFESLVLELPSSSSLPTQLVCLRIVFDDSVCDTEMFSVGRLTSLEELSIQFSIRCKAARRLVKELGSLRELRVLDACICLDDEESQRELVESLSHLHKLQHLKIATPGFPLFISGREMEFVLPCNLRHLVLIQVVLLKLPSCINPWCLPMLSHLDLSLLHMDEKELKTLGSLPELRFLGLDLRCSSATISNIVTVTLATSQSSGGSD
ncbi:disease resistance protein RGA5-like [Miscanthus floridulus]|uniref:disease resistance protein RGA5-like n=1 Tax=Miscanthus floridulus TaxID=154761 RepID=UPI003457AE96